MSAIVKGKIVDTDVSRNSKGGTEQMRERLLRYINPDLLDKVVVHFSRYRKENHDDSVPNIFYAHDLIGDPENKVLMNDGYKKFAKIVFVSHWQRDQFMLAYKIPYSHCTVIENAIEWEFEARQKDTSTIKFIYHTTPHRGLELLFPMFDALSKEFSNIHLDVFSSFEIYGWKERDKQYQKLFDDMKLHPKVTYHGTKSNKEVLAALQEANIFLYPCIWPETSCIAMIEAIRSGCLVIHPSFAALPETASEATIMYDYTEDKHEHARRAYRYTRKVLQYEKQTGEFINSYMADTRCELPRNSIEAFVGKWTDLLKDVTKTK